MLLFFMFALFHIKKIVLLSQGKPNNMICSVRQALSVAQGVFTVTALAQQGQGGMRAYTRSNPLKLLYARNKWCYYIYLHLYPVHSPVHLIILFSTCVLIRTFCACGHSSWFMVLLFTGRCKYCVTVGASCDVVVTQCHIILSSGTFGPIPITTRLLK